MSARTPRQPPPRTVRRLIITIPIPVPPPLLVAALVIAALVVGAISVLGTDAGGRVARTGSSQALRVASRAAPIPAPSNPVATQAGPTAVTTQPDAATPDPAPAEPVPAAAKPVLNGHGPADIAPVSHRQRPIGPWSALVRMTVAPVPTRITHPKMGSANPAKADYRPTRHDEPEDVDHDPDDRPPTPVLPARPVVVPPVHPGPCGHLPPGTRAKIACVPMPIGPFPPSPHVVTVTAYPSASAGVVRR